ncbi:hypothetical protein A4X06_0g8973 [Tilletia controversa]|uniref:Reverse transcriptase domain-containing protein n=1 Tax=Tilletia controversa TaxID=13291 RepID=A0A8X7SSB0_9BASI|nr:hypothetical protein A4X06_0g8973 [Tilletia controversa]
MRALLTKDASILIRNPHLIVDTWDFGAHWAYLRVILPPVPTPLPIGPLPGSSYLGIFSIHGPFTSAAWSPIHTAVELWHPNTSIPCIFGADWNSIPDPILDSSNARPTDPGWTYLRITRANGGPSLTSARRLDSILCSALLLPSLRYSTSVFTSSDHHAVSATFGPEACSPPPPPDGTDASNHNLTWALHPGLWQSASFVRAVRTFASRYTPTHDAGSLSPLEAWKLLSISAHDHLHRLSVHHGSSQRLLIDDLASTSASLISLDCRSASDMTNLPALLSRYRKTLSALDFALSLPYASRLAAAELRLSSWLSKTSSSPRSTPLPTIVHEDSLSTPFTADEVSSALRRANRRASSGPDGLPYRVWSELLPVAGPLLASLANALGAGASLEVTARTILLPKAGDLSNLANYRPISISDSYVRTLARMLSARLLTVASFLLPWNQAAFIPGRRTTLVSGLLQGLIDTTTATPSHPTAPAAFFVISLDQRKAYDRVRHEWLFACLQRLGVPRLLLLLLSALYSSASTRVSTADGMTTAIRFLAGVLQGDPSSCIIYNLTLQPFLDLLRAWGVGILVPGLGLLTSLAFADDVLIFIDASARGLQQWYALQSALDLYERASNAQINTAKSSFWLVGSPADANAASALAATIASYGLANQNHRAFLTHLGHPITLWPRPL